MVADVDVEKVANAGAEQKAAAVSEGQLVAIGRDEAVQRRVRGESPQDGVVAAVTGGQGDVGPGERLGDRDVAVGASCGERVAA